MRPEGDEVLKKVLQRKISVVDVAAILSFIALFAYFILSIRRVFCFPDEYYYLATAQRFIQGARPLVDEWHLAQFACLFFIVPYKLYVAVTGGTAGIILFTRALFLLVNAVFYWIMYLKLRAYSWPALIATIMFCTYIPGGLVACNYYNMAVRLIMVGCLILFGEKQTPIFLLIAGVLLACAGIYQPPLVFFYLGYSLLVWIRFIRIKRGKRFLDDYDSCLNIRAWKYISASASLCISSFLIWLCARSGLRNILTSVPNLLFADPQHDASGLVVKQWSKLSAVFSLGANMYGSICLVCTIVIIVFSILFAFGLFRSRRSTVRRILFYAACAVWILSCIQPIRYHHTSLDYIGWYHVPLFCMGLVCYLLCEQKNKRFFFFWITGLFLTVCVNIVWSSDLSYGFPITYIADIVFFADLVRELRSAQPETKKNRPVRLRQLRREKRLRAAFRYLSRSALVCMALYLCVSATVVNTVFPGFFYWKTSPFSFSFRCDRGPAQRLFYPDAYGTEYNNKLSDFDSIRQKQPNNFFVFGLAPELYLYADVPCAGACTWTLHNDSDLSQHVRYWKLHPESLPECIYVPVDSIANEVQDRDDFLSHLRDSFDPICAYTLEEGKCGYILYVTDWTLEKGSA